MEYILTHKETGQQFSINLADGVSIDNFKELIKGEKEILTLFNLDGTYAGVFPPTFLDDCDISLHGKKASEGTTLVLPRSGELAELFIEVGSIMQKAAENKETLIDGNKIIIRDKNEEEIYDFDWDYNTVNFKYLDFLRETGLPYLILSKEESELMIKTVHAAYYIAGQNGEISDLFEKHYDRYFRKKR
ncbi:hypothetical protein SIO70_00355 [Chitinophaga sancti]|uniref:hypothetical protein n=1 Tax=Chitinophaga sancti TaxID=1004 RepID=UPI002A759571|nr:hypothetical protein [Chitinophaga sancti]WPQ63314.1 hypothetical protein SIO70_00355 [Chitinophaga sancti]